MAINFPGPWTFKLFYETGLSHVLQLNTEVIGDPIPGTPFDEIEIRDQMVAGPMADEVIDDLVALLRPLYSTTSNFIRCELWKNIPESFEMDFWSVYDISLAGTGVGSFVAAGQTIFTFRTYEGGVMKVNLMESLITPGVSQRGASLTPTAATAFKNHFISGANRYLARDTSWPFAFMGMHPGQSEVLFKKRYRAS